MKNNLILVSFAALAVLATASCTKNTTIIETVTIDNTSYTGLVSIQDFGVSADNTADENKKCLQDAINWASDKGAALYVTPVKGGYDVASGLILKKNVTLVGAQGAPGRGTVDSDREPTGSLFKITDTNAPFITVESATTIKGIQFYYPEQAYSNASGIINYPPTIKVSQQSSVQGVTLSYLTFYGETFAMDFRASQGCPCEQIIFEHCYGYPLSGQFIAIDYCYDIPRILHCHVNPANQREFGRGYPSSIIDYVFKRKTYTYWIEHTDNAVVMDIFTFGTYGGIYCGPNTYGQLTNFNFDCVCIGVYKDGGSVFNRSWEVAQGSIIANASPTQNVSEIHPFYVTGYGNISISNVHAFSGKNGPSFSSGVSNDYMSVNGSAEGLTIVATGCRMRNYQSSSPVTTNNKNARIRFSNCIGKDGEFYNFSQH